MSKKEASVFSKDLSGMIKGVAILMMLVHHCFAFPDLWMDGFRVGPITTMISNNFKICVAVFAFIAGYGFFAGRSGTYRDVIRKLFHFLGQYWLQLFLIFLPVACISYSFSVKKILYNLVALEDNIILFAWYVFFHGYVLLTFPLVKRLLNKGPIWDLAVVLVGGYGVTVFLYFLPFDSPLRSMLIDCSCYYPVVGMGYLVAKYNVFDRIGHKISIPVALALVVVVFLLRMKLSVVKGFTFDVFYAPLLILALCRVLEKCRFLHKGLLFLGKYSFHMWLFHSIFFSAYTRAVMQPLVRWSHIPVIRFLLVTALSAGAAVLIDGLWRYILILFGKMRNGIRR